jgi:hypothetical protein
MSSLNIVIFSRPYPFALKGIPRHAQDSNPLRLHNRGQVFVIPVSLARCRSQHAPSSIPAMQWPGMRDSLRPFVTAFE